MQIQIKSSGNHHNNGMKAVNMLKIWQHPTHMTHWTPTKFQAQIWLTEFYTDLQK